MLRIKQCVGFLFATSSKGGYSAVSTLKHLIVGATLGSDSRSGSLEKSGKTNVCLKRAEMPLNETLSTETVLVLVQV